MVKKLVSLALIVMMVLAVSIPAALAGDESPAPHSGYYYVKTGDGKTLNVRNAPNGNIVGHLKYGTRIYVEGFTTPEWALITYTYNNEGFGVGEWAAWVSTRYLVRQNPGKFQRDTAAAQPAAQSTGNDQSTGPLPALNKIFATAKQVDAPYTVVARPSRASGWVNLRWAPSTDAQRISTCPQGKRLTVLVELNGWYQVQDPATGMIGFISSNYVTRQ